LREGLRRKPKNAQMKWGRPIFGKVEKKIETAQREAINKKSGKGELFHLSERAFGGGGGKGERYTQLERANAS